MITKATKQQWDEILRIRDEFPTKTVCAQYGHAEIRRCANLFLDKKCLVFVVDSPRQAMLWSLIMGQLSGQLDDQLREQLREQLNSQLSVQMYGQLYDQLDDQLSDQLSGQLRDQLSGQLRDQLSGQLDEQLSGQLNSQLNVQMYGQLSVQMYDQLRNQLRGQLRNQLSGQLREQLSGQLRDQLSEQLSGQLRDQLRDQLDEQLDEQLNGQLRDQLRGQLRGQLRDQLYYYVGAWWMSWLGHYRGARVLGVNFDKKAFGKVSDWCEKCSTWMWDKSNVYILKNADEIHWDEGLLHCEDGPSVSYSENFKLWTIRGIPVDEQIVMDPGSQSIEQISKEDNADVRAIRIERFGWSRYLKETGSEVVDSWNNPITGCREALYSTPDGSKRFVAVCVTGKAPVMGVPPEIETCEAAQRWLGPQNGNCLAAT